MEEDVRVVLRERRKKCIRFMEEWLKAQSCANAEEGTSGFDPDGLDEDMNQPVAVNGTATYEDQVSSCSCPTQNSARSWFHTLQSCLPQYSPQPAAIDSGGGIASVCPR